MTVTIKNKLKRIADLYPPERVNATRQRLSHLWESGECGARHPYTVRRREIPLGHVNVSMENLSHRECLELQLDEIIRKAHLHDDYIPSLITSNNCYIQAAAMGAEVVRVNGLFVAKPRYRDLDEALRASLPEFGTPVSLWGITRERIRFFLDQTEGTLPMHPPDPQGPLSLASALVNQEEFLCAFYTEPEKVHRFLDLCTEATALFTDAVMEAITPQLLVPIHCHPYNWRPSPGAAYSEDMLGVVGPDLFREFALPRLERLAARFGPLVLHSCGDCSKTISVFQNRDFLKGLNLGQTDITEVAVRWPGRTTINVSIADWKDRQEIQDYRDTVEKHRVPTLFQICTIGSEITQTEELVPAVWEEVGKILER